MQDLNDKTTGDTLPAAEWNEVPSELQNLIEKTGQTLSSLDLDQIGKAVAVYAAGADYYTDSGEANAYTLTAVGSKQTPPAYFNGMKIRFIPANGNTGASTVNVAALGVKALKRADGTDLLSTDLQAGIPVQFQYDTSSGAFLRNGESLQDATTSIKGKIAIATLAEVIAGAVSNEAVVPSTLLNGLDVNLSPSKGHITWPDFLGTGGHGITLQWGVGSTGFGEGTETLTFDIPFPNACLFVTPSYQHPDNDSINNARAELISFNTTQTVLRRQYTESVSGSIKMQYFAVGY